MRKAVVTQTNERGFLLSDQLAVSDTQEEDVGCFAVPVQQHSHAQGVECPDLSLSEGCTGVGTILRKPTAPYRVGAVATAGVPRVCNHLLLGEQHHALVVGQVTQNLQHHAQHRLVGHQLDDLRVSLRVCLLHLQV